MIFVVYSCFNLLGGLNRTLLWFGVVYFSSESMDCWCVCPMLSLFCLLSERGYAKEKLYTGQAEKEGVLEKEYQEPCLYIGCGACISDTGMYLCSIYQW